MLYRKRVDELLRRGLHHTLVTVIAGPGYGKTQAVAGFARNVKRRLAWLDIASLDNDTARFWSSFVHSMQEELPHLATSLSKMEFPDSPGGFDVFLRLLSKELYAGKPLLLVVDNYDNVQNRDVVLFFERLIESELDDLCLVVCSSSKTDVSLDKVKNNSGPYRITTEDLKFTEAEAKVLLRSYGAKLSGDKIRKIVEDADGWPLALYLVSLQLHDGACVVNTTDSPMSYVSELFEIQYFLPYDVFTQNMLTRLAILPCFSTDIVRDLDGRNLSRVVKAIASNIFVSYDYATRIFRFQKMYREFLLHKRSFLSEEDVRQTYSAAGAWFRKSGMTFEALECYWQSREYDAFLEVLMTMPKARISATLSNHVLERLENFPAEYAARNPYVNFSKAFFYLNGMDVDKAHAIFTRLEAQLKEERLNERSKSMLGEVYVALATIDLLRNSDGFAENLKRASCHLPEGSRIQNPNLMLVDNNSAFFIPGNKAGQLDHIVERVFETVPFAEKAMNGSGYGYEWLFAGEAAYHVCDMEKARENCFQAIHKAAQKDQHDIICNAYLVLMRIALFYGDYRDVIDHLAGISQYVEERNLVGLYELRDSAWGWFYIKVGDYRRVAPWISENQSAYYRFMPIAMGRNRLVSACYLMAKRCYREALAALAQMENLFSQKGLWSVRLMVHIMKTECLFRIGDKAAAIDAFWLAYEMTYENNLFALFVESGNAMRTIVDNARKSKKYAFDPDWLDILYHKSTTYAKHLAAVVTEYKRENKIQPAQGIRLSARERQVLGHLSKGLTREEIAELLGISLSGVKKHVGGIYNKLGAINRADAIRIATMDGILE